MKIRLEEEKNLIKNMAAIKEVIEKLRIQEAQAERDGNLNRVAEIRYGEIPNEQKKIEQQLQSQNENQLGVDAAESKEKKN